MRLENLIGQTFGMLTAIEPAVRRQGRTTWLCRCECGNLVTVTGDKLKKISGTKSCGCHRRYARKHGAQSASSTPKQKSVYKSWVGMKQRCLSPRNNRFKYYGARGIQVCEPWANSFEEFWKDMEATWAPGLSIDRIDNDGNYESVNCKWSTPKEQANNRRNNVQ
jgi:hypothetical protein